MAEMKLQPIVGWEMVATQSGYGFLTMRYLPDLTWATRPQAEADKATQSLQLGIGADQCEQLGQALLTMAMKLREARSSAN